MYSTPTLANPTLATRFASDTRAMRCLDALRWGRADLHTLIRDGDARIRAVIERWGLRWPHDA